MSLSARLPLYLHACSLLGVQADAAKVEEMRAKNAQTLKELEDRCAAFSFVLPCADHTQRALAEHTLLHPCLCRSVTDAETNLGESEVREALLAKANFFVKIGDKVRTALAASRAPATMSTQLTRAHPGCCRGGSCCDGEEGMSGNCQRRISPL